MEKILTNFRSVMFDFTWISSSILDSILIELYEKMEKENPFNKYIDEGIIYSSIFF